MSSVAGDVAFLGTLAICIILVWGPIRTHLAYWQRYTEVRYGYRIALFREKCKEKKIEPEVVAVDRLFLPQKGDFESETEAVNGEIEEVKKDG